MLNILNGLSVGEKASKKTKKNDKKGKKEKVLEKIRGAYKELGKKIDDVEEKERSDNSKDKKGEQKDNKEGKTTKDDKGKNKNNGEKSEKKKGKKKGEDEDEDEEDEEDEDEEDGDKDDEDEDDDNYFDPSKVSNDEDDKARAKAMHLKRALLSIKKAGEHMDMAEGKRVKKLKNKAQEPMDEEAYTRNGKDWKKLAKKLARQLDAVLKEVKKREAQHKLEKSKLRYMLAILARQEWARRQRERGHDDDTMPEDEEEDDSYDEDGRSRILNNMAAKLLRFDKHNKEFHFTHGSLSGKEVLKRENVLHTLVSRYRGLIAKILANWIKIKKKGKKKSKIPKKRGFGKRTEIERGKGNHTTKAAERKSLTHVIRSSRMKVKKAGKEKKKRRKPKQMKEKPPTIQTEDDEDVVEVVN